MPFSDLLKRKEYHRKYMNEYNKTHSLTPAQILKKKLSNENWIKNNSEKLKAYQHERWLKDKEKITIRKNNYYKNNPKVRVMQGKNYYKKPEVKLRIYKRGADSRGLKFTLTSEEFESIIQGICHYCDSSQSIGIDRKDNKIGYTLENSLPCCKTCNFMKGTLSYKDFINQAKTISRKFN